MVMIQRKRMLALAIAFCMISSLYAQTAPLRVISYNIFNGFDFGKDTLRQRQTAQWINRQSPDIVGLQELCGYSDERLEREAAQWGHGHSALLKTNGYSVGLTANQPIQVIERITNGLWHGMLHCEVAGLHVFIVHLSPDDYHIRGREIDTLLNRLDPIKAANKPYFVLGDFNAHSPVDADLDRQRPKLLESYRVSDAKSSAYSHLNDNYFDYSVMSKLLAYGMADVCARFVPHGLRFTYPASILIGSYRKNPQHVVDTRERLDYIMASPDLARICVDAHIDNGQETDLLSDHYPIVADFHRFQ